MDKILSKLNHKNSTITENKNNNKKINYFVNKKKIQTGVETINSVKPIKFFLLRKSINKKDIQQRIQIIVFIKKGIQGPPSAASHKNQIASTYKE